MDIFNEGHLIVWTLGDLQLAVREVDPSKVRFIRVGARCYSALKIEELLERLKYFSPLDEIELGDDRIPDEDMPSAQKEFERVFPLTLFKWGFDRR